MGLQGRQALRRHTCVISAGDNRLIVTAIVTNNTFHILNSQVRERMRDAAETLGGEAGKSKRRTRLGGVVKNCESCL